MESVTDGGGGVDDWWLQLPAGPSRCRRCTPPMPFLLDVLSLWAGFGGLLRDFPLGPFVKREVIFSSVGLHIVPHRKFDRIGGTSSATFPNFRYVAPR